MSPDLPHAGPSNSTTSTTFPLVLAGRDSSSPEIVEPPPKVSRTSRAGSSHSHSHSRSASRSKSPTKSSVPPKLRSRTRAAAGDEPDKARTRTRVGARVGVGSSRSPRDEGDEVKLADSRRIVGKGRDKGKGKMKVSAADLEAATFAQDLEDTDDDNDDDDDPVFLHETIAKRLADKYTYHSSSSSSIGSSSRVDLSASTSKAKPKRSTPSTATTKLRTKATTTATPRAPLPLAQPPSPHREPIPVPDWLGKTAVLLQLKCCVVCKRQWKKSESGAARWRHISMCITPPYRPPNDPPDLQQLINDGLLASSGPRTPTSLLDLHVNAFGERVDNRPDLVAVDRTTTKPIKGSGSMTAGLRRITSVKPVEDRGVGWKEEVDVRLEDLFGVTRKRTSRSPSIHGSPPSSPVIAFPPTQPLGESALAAAYARPTETEMITSPESPTLLLSPGKSILLHSDEEQGLELDQDQDPPIPLASQTPRSASDDEDEMDENGVGVLELGEPFRWRGGSRAEGNLPWKRSAEGDRERKRIRAEGSFARGW